MREPGEFAVRGGIVDLYPAGAAEPLRLDFFGDTLESLRSFDPLTQRSTGTLDESALRPVSEVLLDDAGDPAASARATASSSARPAPTTRSTNRSAPGGAMPAWSIGCRSITSGWRPCSTTCPGAAVSLDHQAEEVRGHRLEAIADFYAARHSITARPRARGAPVYRPVRPDQLYLDEPRMAGGAARPRRRAAVALCRAG